jgi:hypothetical protein
MRVCDVKDVHRMVGTSGSAVLRWFSHGFCV